MIYAHSGRVHFIRPTCYDDRFRLASRSPSVDKDVISDRIPRIVNANKEEHERRGANEEQGWARMGPSHVCRDGQHCICRNWEVNMKQPVLKYWPVDSLHSHSPGNDHGVPYSTKAH